MKARMPKRKVRPVMQANMRRPMLPDIKDMRALQRRPVVWRVMPAGVPPYRRYLSKRWIGTIRVVQR